MNDQIVPARLRPKSSSIGLNNINYCFPSIQRNCWRPLNSFGTCMAAQIHICDRLNHSCMGNIVSSAHLQSKSTWRSAARAFAHLTRLFFCNGWSGGGADCMAHNIKQSGLALRTATTHCIVCNSALGRPALFTSDAGQAFEALSQSNIDLSISKVLDLAKVSRATSVVQVLRVKPYITAFGGDIS